MWRLSLTNFEIQKYFESETNFKGVYSRTIYVKIRNGEYLKILDEYKLKRTNWKYFHVNKDNGQDLRIQPFFSTYLKAN